MEGAIPHTPKVVGLLAQFWMNLIRRTLLLNSTYECISFISERKVFKLLAKDKIEVLESWDDKVTFGRDSFGKPARICHPAVARLRHHVRWIPRKIRFN